MVRQSQFEMVRFMFQCPITKTGNLYSALQDTPGSRQNLVKIDTKVDRKLYYVVFWKINQYCLLAYRLYFPGTLQLAWTGLAVEGPANGGHLFPVLADGFATENGGWITAIRALH